MIIDRNFKFEVGKYYVSKLLWEFATPRKCLTVREAVYGGFAKCQYATFCGIAREYIANPVQFREATADEILNAQARGRLDCKCDVKYKAYPLALNVSAMKDFIELSKN